MPAAFDKCLKKKGRKVRTIHPHGRDDVYLHICIPPEGGPSVAGDVHHIGDKARKGGGASSDGVVIVTPAAITATKLVCPF